MRNLAKTCGLVALVVSAALLNSTEAQAGGRRCACYSPGYFYTASGPAYVTTTTAPAPAVVTTDGRLRYRSAYQAPAAAPVPVFYPAPVIEPTNSWPPAFIPFEQRSFSEQNRADRKIRDF